ncbi:hypothetical protein LSH36_304g02051 [Paralvinella palmiformis]|uniref:Uncharacterized protein n=1 Tax=Paralvinella palmiformis TaxID=53620 RepID=A0AAD9N2M5_9ANNE|nr:hypothetical protein LSH36_304g02051 [Paralvinella palmiformis]
MSVTPTAADTCLPHSESPQ